MTKTSNTKTLNITNIDKKVKDLNKQSEVKVYSSTINDYFTFKVDETLKKTKIMNLVSEVMSQLQYAHKKGIDLQAVFLPYSILMLMKYFTSFGKSVPSELSAQLEVMNKMIDLDILQPILEVFPGDQSEEVFNTINAAIKDIDDRYNELASRVEEIQKAFENGEIEKLIDITDEDWIEMSQDDSDADE